MDYIHSSTSPDFGATVKLYLRLYKAYNNGDLFLLGRT